MPTPGVLDYISFTEFDGMNTQSDRMGLDPKKLAWCENLQPISKSQLTVVPGPNSPIADLNVLPGSTLIRFFFATVNSVSFLQDSNGNLAAVVSTKDVLICFSGAGAAFELNLATNVVFNIGPVGTFSTNPDVAQWKSERVLIADTVAGYCSWDGFSLTKAGGVSPNVTVTASGGAYAHTPAVTISGGGGSGALAFPVLTGGTSGLLSSIFISNAASSGYTSNPTIGFSPSTGSAANTAFWPTPSVLPVSTLAVFVGRVWMAAVRALEWTGVNGYDDFSPGNAAGFTTLSDSDLPHQIIALRALNNYLYVFCDGAIKQIGSVTLSGSTTNFTFVTLSSDQGTLYPMTIKSYNRLVVFANKTGVFAIFGASIEKISDDMDGIFENADFTFSPQAAIADINAIHTYLLLLRFNDIAQGVTRTIILALMGKRWYVINAGNALCALGSAFYNGLNIPYASGVWTIGQDVTQILAAQFAPVNFLLRTALTANKKPMQQKRALRALVSTALRASASVNVLIESENGSTSTAYTGNETVLWNNNLNQNVQFINNLSQFIFFVGGGYLVEPLQAPGATGIYLGMTLSGTSNQMKIIAMTIEHENTTMMRSQNSTT